MPWGPRVGNPSPVQAEGDKLYVYGQYNDISGNLVGYMPVYKDMSDAAEWNVENPVTAITVGTNSNVIQFGQNQKQSAGRVVTATNFNSGFVSSGDVPAFVGVYNPEVPGTRPSTGDMIRIQRFGATPVAISAGQAPNVADFLNTSGTQALFLTKPRNSPSIGDEFNYVGRVLGTSAQISTGQAINPVQQTASGQPPFQYFLVNGWIDK